MMDSATVSADNPFPTVSSSCVDAVLQAHLRHGRIQSSCEAISSNSSVRTEDVVGSADASFFSSELSPFCSVSRPAFVLLKRLPGISRKERIRTMQIPLNCPVAIKKKIEEAEGMYISAQVNWEQFCGVSVYFYISRWDFFQTNIS